MFTGHVFSLIYVLKKANDQLWSKLPILAGHIIACRLTDLTVGCRWFWETEIVGNLDSFCCSAPQSWPSGPTESVFELHSTALRSLIPELRRDHVVGVSAMRPDGRVGIVCTAGRSLAAVPVETTHSKQPSLSKLHVPPRQPPMVSHGLKTTRWKIPKVHKF